jgi:hypothetical protein
MAYIINISVVFKVVYLLQPMYHYAFIHSPVIIIPDLQEISGNHGWMLSAVCDAPISRFKASKDLTTNKWMCIYIYKYMGIWWNMLRGVLGGWPHIYIYTKIYTVYIYLQDTIDCVVIFSILIKSGRVLVW